MLNLQWFVFLKESNSGSNTAEIEHSASLAAGPFPYTLE
jgi:hypothetical protein